MAGTTTPTRMRVAAGSNSAGTLFSDNVAWSTSYSHTWLDGYDFACFYPINEVGVENTDVNASKCGNLALIVNRRSPQIATPDCHGPFVPGRGYVTGPEADPVIGHCRALQILIPLVAQTPYQTPRRVLRWIEQGAPSASLASF